MPTLNLKIWALDVASGSMNVIAELTGYTNKIQVTTDCKIVLLRAGVVYVYGTDGTLTSNTTTQLPATETSYQALLLPSGNFFIAHVNSATSKGDFSIVKPDGTIVSSYSALKDPSGLEVTYPQSIDLFGSDYVFVSDWNPTFGHGIYLVKQDLTGNRALLHGARQGVGGSATLNYNAQSGLLIVRLIDTGSVNAFKVVQPAEYF